MFRKFTHFLSPYHFVCRAFHFIPSPSSDLKPNQTQAPHIITIQGNLLCPFFQQQPLGQIAHSGLVWVLKTYSKPRLLFSIPYPDRELCLCEPKKLRHVKWSVFTLGSNLVVCLPTCIVGTWEHCRYSRQNQSSNERFSTAVDERLLLFCLNFFNFFSPFVRRGEKGNAYEPVSDAREEHSLPKPIFLVGFCFKGVQRMIEHRKWVANDPYRLMYVIALL